MIDRAEFEESGRAWVRNAIPPAELERLSGDFQIDGRAGDRPAIDSPVAKYLLAPNPVSDVATSLGLDPAPVRLAVFNKSEATNWSVPWHQDRVVAVAGRHHIPGYTNWLPKHDCWHAEPPPHILESMIFVRLHIDAADGSNGSLQLALGSHRMGRIPADHAASVAASLPVETCSAAPGDLLIVKALTLHRSASSESASPRRAVRIDYAERTSLASPLRWAIPAPPES